MSLSFDDAIAAWSRLHGGYEPAQSVVVRSWLRVMYVVAKPLAALGISPVVLTACGVACAVAACVATSPGSAALILGAAVFDGLDGAVAIQRSRASPRGAWVDRAADRVTDVLFGVALWNAGALGWVAILAVVATLGFELVRHRITAGGRSGIVTVTIGDRPFRVVVVAVGVVVGPTVCASLLVVAAVVSCVHLAAASASVSRRASDHVRDDRGRQKDERDAAAGVGRTADKE